MSDRLGVSDYESFRAYISSGVWLAQSALFEDRDHRSGRRGLFEPHVLMLFFYGTTAVWKSARKTAAQLADTDHWTVLQNIVRQLHPSNPEVWLPERAPRRHHYLYFRRRHVDPNVGALQELHETLAAQQALAVGLCDPNGGGSWTRPHSTRTWTADGKVGTPLFRSSKPTRVNRATGEIKPVRYDPDAKLHVSGDGRSLWGNKFEILHVRGPGRHQRVILSVDAVHRSEGETLLAMIDRVVPRLPGTQAIAYDGGIRGVHLNHILTRNGILPVVPARGSTADQAPAPLFLEAKGGKRLFTQVGSLGLGHVTENGEIAFARLARKKTLRRRRRDGSFYWYSEYKDDQNTQARVRLDQTDEDHARGINRPEHLRAIAKGDPEFDRIMGIRSDSESVNRYFEDSLFNGRAHSIGRIRQLVDLLGFATSVNAVAVYRHSRTSGPPEASA